ncbi:MAG: serine/threonine-protein kinase [Polyangiaceae bacterium]
MARPTLPRPEVTRYVLFDRIGSGGMASVHVARLLGPAGFSRTVAVKRLLPHLATDDRFVAMLLDEARIAARVCHPCVVSVLDLVNENHELLLVMDYVHGEALSRLVRAAEGAGVPPPPAVASAILVSALLGLHAAHEATSADGAPLGIVHRDVSPQNILVAADGIARVADFGIAMASARLQVTTPGELKGKLAYMAPEQALGSAVDRRADLYSAGVILWELLTGRRMFPAGELDRLLARARPEPVDPPSRYSDRIAPEVDHVVMRALARAPENRFATAKELARALEVALPPASAVTVGEWVESACGEALAVRARRIADIELSTEPDIELIPLTTQAGVSPAARPW